MSGADCIFECANLHNLTYILLMEIRLGGCV